MTLPVAFPVRLDAPLSGIDPRWKLAALLPAAAVAGSLRTPGPALTALAGAALMVWFARLSLRWYLARIGSLVIVLALFLVFLPFLDHGMEERWNLGGLSLSPRGLTFAVVLLVKAVALLSLLMAAATTAPADVYLKALHCLRVPGVVVQIAALTVRYLAVVLEEFGTIRIALRVRGYRQHASLESLRTVGHVAGMLVVRSSERAERVAQALRCRGFDGRFQALTTFRTRAVDVLFFGAVVAAAAGVLAWDLNER
jgi:cobalt/nickel transport system permease protein